MSKASKMTAKSPDTNPQSSSSSSEMGATTDGGSGGPKLEVFEMPLNSPRLRLAHDFTCIHCWAALHHAKKLKNDVGATIEFEGYEQFPEGTDFPGTASLVAGSDEAKEIERRFISENIDLPSSRLPDKMRTHNAHEAVEYAKTLGVADELVERLYVAYWKHGLPVNDLEVIEMLATGLVDDKQAMRRAIEAKQFAGNIGKVTPAGVQVPTYWVGNTAAPVKSYSDLMVHFIRHSETTESAPPLKVTETKKPAVEAEKAPEPVIESVKIPEPVKAQEPVTEVAPPPEPLKPPELVATRVVEVPKVPEPKKPATQADYAQLQFPPAPSERPYIFINMVSTIDGKTVSGDRHEAVSDLGSDTDHKLMRQIEKASNAVLLGAGSLRANTGLWYPNELLRFVATNSGNLPIHSRFFSDAPGRAFAIGPLSARVEGVQLVCFGEKELDWTKALRWMRLELGVDRLLVEGGSELNAQLIAAGLVDELFLTVAPWVKLGAGLPTYAGGEPLPKGELQAYEIVDLQREGNEVFIRYRRKD